MACKYNVFKGICKVAHSSHGHGTIVNMGYHIRLNQKTVILCGYNRIPGCGFWVGSLELTYRQPDVFDTNNNNRLRLLDVAS